MRRGSGYVIDDALYARVIDCLADHEGQAAVHLAMLLGEDSAKVKRILREAEGLGQTTCQGRRWYLG
ncbi:MAG: hypothetical protein EP330_01975 [Deltaproteobacteria bacterium]|nr:MAG: hypothetical protein EP330_01975 [Deltaproteobacteria bacterium]